MRTLALDHGERRIGVAVTDETGVLAQPLETIDRPRRGGDRSLERIEELVKAYQVGRIVVGLPLHMDGRAGDEADRARAFGERVAERTGVRVDYLDERWTSKSAKRALREGGVRESKQRGRIDRVAAALLLQTYLERGGA